MLKRIFDLGVCSVGVIILSPVLLFIALIILVLNGPPVFYKQKRLGKNNELFILYKFRTMSLGESMSSKHDESRITPFGRFLRKTSFDELPVLFNVLQGNMSLVGPRPLLMKYADRYTPYQNRRHEVLPGITGLAQVRGRNTLSWEEKFEYDVYYVDHRNFYLDLKILLLTFWQVITRKNISPVGEKIMPEFMGTLEKNGSDKQD